MLDCSQQGNGGCDDQTEWQGNGQHDWRPPPGIVRHAMHSRLAQARPRLFRLFLRIGEIQLQDILEIDLGLPILVKRQRAIAGIPAERALVRKMAVELLLDMVSIVAESEKKLPVQQGFVTLALIGEAFFETRQAGKAQFVHRSEAGLQPYIVEMTGGDGRRIRPVVFIVGHSLFRFSSTQSHGAGA